MTCRTSWVSRADSRVFPAFSAAVVARLNRFFETALWKRWAEAIVNPGLSDADLRIALSEARQRLPVPVFWLLGKAQSGKTSIVRALTAASAVEIGSGFQPCTRTARAYDFPDNETAFIRFLDTRGLAEVGYDSAEDMAYCESQAHLLVVAIRAMDPQQDAVRGAVAQVRRSHPDWPVIVAQTCLHEGYPSRETAHALPYPYEIPEMPGVPADLRRALLSQRAWFEGTDVRCVAVDFTLPEDGYEPEHYGLDALWDAIEAALPLGLRAMLVESGEDQSLNDAYAHSAHSHIVSYALLAGSMAAIPAPVAGLAAALGFQAKLFHSIAAVYGLKLTTRSVSEVSSALGLGILAGMSGRELVRMIPIYGTVVAGIYNAAMTYALGKTFCAYFGRTRQGQAFQPEVLRRVYQEEFARGQMLVRERMRRPATDKESG